MFLCANNEVSEREPKKTITVTIASKKYPRITLAGVAQWLSAGLRVKGLLV